MYLPRFIKLISPGVHLLFELKLRARLLLTAPTLRAVISGASPYFPLGGGGRPLPRCAGVAFLREMKNLINIYTSHNS